MSELSEEGEKTGFSDLISEQPSKKDQQIQELQDQLAYEKDARQEERFVSIVVLIIVFDIVFFSVMPSFGGPLALVLLEVLVLIPLARRMGIQEIVQILSRVLDRISSSTGGNSTNGGS